MYDHTLLLGTLSDFTERLLRPDADAVPEELMSGLVDVLGLVGCGVALSQGRELRFAAGVPTRVEELERVQIDGQAGPGTDAFLTGAIVAVADLSERREHWPAYCAAAEKLGLTSVAAIPMGLGGTRIGAVNLYAEGRRDWLAEELAAARVMTDLATGSLINASKLREQEQLNEQLLRTLESRSIIEQAKGAVAATHDLDVDQAFHLIRSHARSHNVSVRSVAEAIVKLKLTI